MAESHHLEKYKKLPYFSNRLTDFDAADLHLGCHISKKNILES